MSSTFSLNSPAWLLQPKALKNVISNHYASLKDVPSYVNVPDFTSFSSGLKQALYWRRRLSPSSSANTVIFSLLGEKGLILPNVLEVFQALKSICDMTKVVEFYRAMNSSFIGISFSNDLEAAKIRSLFTFFQNSLVIHVSPASSLLHHFKLLWLPPLFPDSCIHHFLSKHSVHHHFTRDFVSTDVDIRTPANSVSGTIELSPTYDIASLPHLIPLPSPHLGSALLIVSGRPSLCLKCGTTGHIRRVCPSPRCSKCHHFHPVLSHCSSANDPSLSSSITPWIDFDPDYVSDPIAPELPHTFTSMCDRTLDASSLDMQPSESAVITSLSPLADTAPIDCPHDLSSSPCASTLPISHDSADPSDSSFIIVKRVTRSMTSAKRTFSSTSQSSLPSDIDTHFNIYHTLTDEANSTTGVPNSHISTLHRSHSSGNLSSPVVLKEPDCPANVSPSTATVQSVCLLATQSHATAALDFGITDSKSDNSSTLNSHKRVRLSPSELSSSKSLLTDSAVLPHSPSWADQAEMDLEKSEELAALPYNSTFSSPLSSLPNTSVKPTIINDTSDMQPSVDLSASSSDSESDDKFFEKAVSTLSHYIDPDLDSLHHVCLLGFPDNTPRSYVLAFLHPIMPISMWHLRGPNKTFVGNFGATFTSHQDAALAISKHGHAYQKSKISIDYIRSSHQEKSEQQVK